MNPGIAAGVSVDDEIEPASALGNSSEPALLSLLREYDLVVVEGSGIETDKAFTSFVEKGWKAEAGARAAAGTEGASADTTFSNGLAIYQMTEKGLMANADISGTKYWKNKKLNGE